MGGYSTHKAETEYPESGNGMEQQANTEHIDMNDANNQVIDEVSNSKCLDQTASTCVAEDTLTSRHLAALGISEHDPQRSDVDQNTLDQRNDMNIPVELGPGIQLGVVLREEDRRQPWRQERVDELVKGEGDNNFMDVVREGWAAQREGIGLDQVPQPCWRGAEGVQHRGMRSSSLSPDVGSSNGRW